MDYDYSVSRLHSFVGKRGKYEGRTRISIVHSDRRKPLHLPILAGFTPRYPKKSLEQLFPASVLYQTLFGFGTYIFKILAKQSAEQTYSFLVLLIFLCFIHSSSGEIRTHTAQILSLYTLPVGLYGAKSYSQQSYYSRCFAPCQASIGFLGSLR